MVDPSPFGRVVSLTVVGEQLANKAVKHVIQLDVSQQTLG
jgi:hypothetical protein